MHLILKSYCARCGIEVFLLQKMVTLLYKAEKGMLNIIAFSSIDTNISDGCFIYYVITEYFLSKVCSDFEGLLVYFICISSVFIYE